MNIMRLLKTIPQNGVQIAKIDLPKKIERQFYLGEEITENFVPKVYLKNSRGQFSDFLAGGTSVLVVSNKVKTFLEQSSEQANVRFIKVEFASAKVREDYFLLNILNPISCIDRDKSIFEVPPENPDTIILLQKMVIDPIKVEDRKLFYMRELAAHVFVEESFVEEMRDYGINSIRLLPLVGDTN